MHLRGIPVETERLAKSEAARRGISLSEFVSEAILRATQRGHGDLEHRLSPLASERAWYDTHRNEIAKTYDGKIVAIADGGVLAVGESLVDVARDVRSRIGDRPAYVVNLTAQSKRRVAPSPARHRA